MLKLDLVQMIETCIIENKGKTIFKSSLETISQNYHNSFSNLFAKSV